MIVNWNIPQMSQRILDSGVVLVYVKHTGMNSAAEMVEFYNERAPHG